MKCPCNPTRLYKDCCAAAHNDITTVQTAEQLMRSRYSAFVLSKAAYLFQIHYTDLRPTLKEYQETARWSQTVKWIKLEVLQTTNGLEKNLTGSVYFKAFYFENGSVQMIEEHSKFNKENGHWVYVGGY